MFSLKGKELGKRFYRQWVFRGVNFSLEPGDRILIRGSNGSGKSTLMRIIAGQLRPTRGELSIINGKRRLDHDHYYRFFSWSGPYMDLYTDLSLKEAVNLHFRFRENLIPKKEIIERLRLDKDDSKLLRHFSSGMIHRVKVGLSIFSKSKVLLLDEATTNMDAENSNYILKLMDEFLGKRILVYASNREEEFSRFSNQLDLSAPN